MGIFNRYVQPVLTAEFSRDTVERYGVYLESRQLSTSSLNLRVTFIRKLAERGRKKPAARSQVRFCADRKPRGWWFGRMTESISYGQIAVQYGLSLN